MDFPKFYFRKLAIIFISNTYLSKSSFRERMSVASPSSCAVKRQKYVPLGWCEAYHNISWTPAGFVPSRTVSTNLPVISKISSRTLATCARLKVIVVDVLNGLGKLGSNSQTFGMNRRVLLVESVVKVLVGQGCGITAGFIVLPRPESTPEENKIGVVKPVADR